MALKLYSIGHSNHPLGVFLGLLGTHGVEVLVDVRSHPYSRFAPQFNRDALRQEIHDRGVSYLFLGDSLGGRPDDRVYYDEDGHVLYGRVAKAGWFRAGIDRLCTGASKYQVAIMCSEEDPTNCHRRLLVGRVLGQRGADVVHIRRDGRLMAESELAAECGDQASLFDEASGLETEQWRSTQSVLRASQRLSSSIS